MASCVIAEHPLALLHVEFRRNRHLWRPVADVVVHFEIDQKLPVSICASIGFQMVSAVRPFIQQERKFRLSVVFRAHPQIFLRVFFSASAVVPVFIWHVVFRTLLFPGLVIHGLDV